MCASPPSILVGLQVQLQHCTTYGAFKNWIQSGTSVKHWQQHLPLETKEVLPCLPLFCFVLPDKHVHLWQFYLAPSEPNKSSKIAIWVLFYCYQMNLTVAAPPFFLYSAYSTYASLVLFDSYLSCVLPILPHLTFLLYL